jgi:mono/diheme cytochrome c family protein
MISFIKTTQLEVEEGGARLAPKKGVASRSLRPNRRECHGLQQIIRQIIRHVAPAFLLILTYSINAHSAFAQDEEPDPANGAAIFAARCANCHGPLGLGDGELAVNLPNPPTPIGSPDFLATADLFSLAQTIYNGRVDRGMPGFGAGNNSTPLTEKEIFDVVAGLFELERMNQPIPAARVTGQVGNGSTGNLISQGTVTLQALTPDFEEGLTFTTDILPDGSFDFELSNLPPNWFYRTIVNYADLEFSSNVGRLTPFETEAVLNVAVFDQTNDDSDIRIWQHQTLVDFGPNTVQVAEIYLVSNTGSAVYVGETPESGTVQIPVPSNAEDIIFLQGFGSASSFAPITNPAVQNNIWRPDLPVLPGDGAVQLLIRYILPFEPGMTISHPLPYPTNFIELSIPDIGVLISTEADWRPEDPAADASDAAGQTEPRLRYSRSPLPPNSNFEFALTGFPSVVLDSEGNRVQQRDDVSELLIGSVALVIVAAIVTITGYSWSQQPAPASNQQELVRRIAALDLAHDEKAISKRAWRQKRSELLDQLKSVWK